MSIFLEAIERMDEIKIDEELKPYFSEVLNRSHHFFTENNLLGVFDLEHFFDVFLFKGNREFVGHFGREKARKLEIKYKRKNIFTNLTYKKNWEGYFDFDKSKNKIIVYKPRKKHVKENNEIGISFDEMILRTITHEFVHFLTIGGFATKLTKDNERIDLVELDDFYDYRATTYWLEAFTEKMALDILGVKINPAYSANKIAVDFITEVFDITYENFLLRDFSTMIPYMSEQTFNDMGYCLHYLMGVDKESIEFSGAGMQLITELALETYKHKVFLTRYDMNEEEFLVKQIDIVSKIPFKSAIEYEQKLNEINEIYVTALLEKNNLKPTTTRINAIIKKMNNAINMAQEDDLFSDYSHEIETGAVVKHFDQSLTFFKRRDENTLSVFSNSILEYFHEHPMSVDLFKLDNESFKDASFKYQAENLEVFKEKNKPIIISLNPKIPTFKLDQNNKSDKVEFEIPEPTIVSFDNGKLKILNNNTVRVVDLTNKNQHKEYRKTIIEIKELLHGYHKTNKDIINFQKYKKIYEVINNKNKDAEKDNDKDKTPTTDPNFVLVNKKR